MRDELRARVVWVAKCHLNLQHSRFYGQAMLVPEVETLGIARAFAVLSHYHNRRKTGRGA